MGQYLANFGKVIDLDVHIFYAGVIRMNDKYKIKTSKSKIAYQNATQSHYSQGILLRIIANPKMPSATRFLSHKQNVFAFWIVILHFEI